MNSLREVRWKASDAFVQRARLDCANATVFDMKRAKEAQAETEADPNALTNDEQVDLHYSHPSTTQTLLGYGLEYTLI